MNSSQTEPDLDAAFIERERNRFAGRALSFLVALNGIAALVLLIIVAMEPQATVVKHVRGDVDSRAELFELER